MSEKPRRAYRTELIADGDTKEEMVRMIEDFLEALQKGSTGFVSGGCGSGGYFNVTCKPEITHEIYVEKLNAYLSDLESTKKEGKE